MADKPRLTAVGAGEGAPPRPRAKSTIAFPYADLAEVHRAARLVAESLGECRPEQLAAWLGHRTLNSGAFRNKVAAAKLFGLLEGGRNRIRLTGLGNRAVEVPTVRQALVEAFLSPPLYRSVFESHRGRRLPGNLGIELEMVRLGVSRSQVQSARQVFFRSAEQAGFLEAGPHQLVLPPGTVFPPAAPGDGAERRPGTGYPKVIEAILEQAPWNSAWDQSQFEAWAELFVQASRVHFRLIPDGEKTDSGT